MATIDASIIPTRQVQPNFAGLSSDIDQIIGLQKNRLAIQQAQQGLQANQAASAAIQAGTDQQGNIDVPKILSTLGQDPKAAYNLPQIANQLYQMQGSQFDQKNKKLDNLAKQNEYFGKLTGGWFEKGDKISKQDVSNGMSQAIAAGMIEPKIAMTYLADLPTEREDDPAFKEKMKEWVTTHFTNTRSNQAQLEMFLPKQTIQDTGSGYKILQTRPLTGDVKVVGELPKDLSPTDLTTPFEYRDSAGNLRTTTKGNFLKMLNDPKADVGGNPNASAGYSGDGRYPKQANAQGGNVAGIVTGMTPEASAARAELGSSGQKLATDLSSSASGVPLRVSNLKLARDLVSDPKVSTGPGSDWRNTMKSFIGSLAPATATSIFGKDFNPDTAKFEEFNKLMANYANQASSGLGTGTNARLNTALTGNANTNIQSLANKDILTRTIAAEQMIAAKNKAWQAAGLTGDKYPQWEANFNEKIAPEAFVFSAMPTADRKAYVAKLQEQDKKNGTHNYENFVNDLNSSIKNGYIQPPGR